MKEWSFYTSEEEFIISDIKFNQLKKTISWNTNLYSHATLYIKKSNESEYKVAHIIPLATSHEIEIPFEVEVGEYHYYVENWTLDGEYFKSMKQIYRVQ